MDEEGDEMPVYSPSYVDRWPRASRAFLKELKLCRLLDDAEDDYVVNPSPRSEAHLQAVVEALKKARQQYERATDEDEAAWRKRRADRAAAKQHLAEVAEQLEQTEIGG